MALVVTLFVNWELHGDGIAVTADYQCGLEDRTTGGNTRYAVRCVRTGYPVMEAE